MTALAKLFRATAFRLTLVYLLVFALFAAFLLGYFVGNEPPWPGREAGTAAGPEG